jgi:endonuclease-3
VARESQPQRRRRAARIASRLARAYPDAAIALDYRNPFELLVATILSAQCTDARVNQVTPELFRRWPNPAALAAADPDELEAQIRPTGFYRQKAKALLASARGIQERFGGEVPRELEALVSLRGVARKTANVVRGGAFGLPGLAVDTHVRRVSQRLALTGADDPERIERDLMELLPQKAWTPFSIRTIHHGRVCCQARQPRCDACPLRADCPWPRSQAPKQTPKARAASARRSRAASRRRAQAGSRKAGRA